MNEYTEVFADTLEELKVKINELENRYWKEDGEYRVYELADGKVYYAQTMAKRYMW